MMPSALQYNFEIISAALLQLYSSVLTFALWRSVIRRLFKDEIPECVTLSPRTDEDWYSCLYEIGHLHPHNEGFYKVRAMGFSHDDSFMITAANDGALRLSRVDTGTCVVESYSHNIICVSFSLDSSLVASLTRDGEARL